MKIRTWKKTIEFRYFWKSSLAHWGEGSYKPDFDCKPPVKVSSDAIQDNYYFNFSVASCIQYFYVVCVCMNWFTYFYFKCFRAFLVVGGEVKSVTLTSVLLYLNGKLQFQIWHCCGFGMALPSPESPPLHWERWEAGILGWDKNILLETAVRQEN